MNSLVESFSKALYLILSLDKEVISIISLSLKVSCSALLVTALVGLPAGAFLAMKKFPLRTPVINILNTFMGLPPVVVGLFVYLLLSRRGPLGFMALLYTPSAMVIAQSMLCFPIIASLSHSAILGVDPIIRQTAVTLGATPFQASLTVFKEARYGIMAAVIAAFGRVMAEVGAILIVGGNIAGYTRVMTTTIAMETDKGNFELALALGVILLSISLAINSALHFFQRQGIRGAGK